MKLAAERHVTIPRLLVESALTGSRGETLTQRKKTIVELFKIHRLLATISNNVNRMTRAINAAGEVQTELTSMLAAVKRTAQ